MPDAKNGILIEIPTKKFEEHILDYLESDSQNIDGTVFAEILNDNEAVQAALDAAISQATIEFMQSPTGQAKIRETIASMFEDDIGDGDTSLGAAVNEIVEALQEAATDKLDAASAAKAKAESERSGQLAQGQPASPKKRR